ncbi:LOW QUALITY PROTEIN: tumor necrosis factor receptor superfamily member 14 [Ctenopharyngodon idella]|uniref:LOW QUALITY PROTEIN: tumor necrosis factor receptor superfamily member 14 n=1 Tax=Ctenopharyngodon idella TaxID=7959 RepID=UPI002231A4FE|nr:LOW QUALITY PROTEIN: tumor necrosis factor receptor superfamily member 14 [Ctenopharyngodon idella]
MTKEFVIAIFLFVLCTLLGLGKACGPSEYKSAIGECCPMCNIGTVVRRDCIGDLSTSCQPCAPETFMNEPNGLHTCFPCKTCAESQGLYIQSKCSTIKNTICDVLDGYYCRDYSNSQCLHALKHSVCAPGQETKSPGTKTSDTVCVDCPPGFYSPSGLNCIRWTDCTARNEIEAEKGSSEKDVTCTPKIRERYGLILAVVLTSLLYIILLLISQSTSCKLKHPIEETTPADAT